MQIRGDGQMRRIGISFIIVTMCMATIIFAGKITVFAQDTKPQTQNKDSQKNDHKRLEGKWVRPDGGYILELKNIGSAGDVKAVYYNPRPINVGISNWRVDDGNLTVFVELRDINYQGSTYTLQYGADSDRLKGKYFQAPTGRTYEVEFVRVKQ